MSHTSSTGRQIEDLITSERLPVDFTATVTDIYFPLAGELASRAGHRDRPLIVGINGAQGTGKSTLTRFLALLLESEFGLRTAAFSLDDIYHTRARRNDLARKIHPLLAVRGVPGTHDIALGDAVLDDLLNAGGDDRTPVPAFDKAVDDRVPREQWRSFPGRPGVIIVEGWCVAAVPEDSAALESPINELEREEDSDGRWRRFVNRQLETGYRDFFSRFDVLVFIRAPCWDMVYQWRLLQEEKLAERCREQGLDDAAVMTAEQVARFVQFYERVTRHTLSEMAGRADYVLSMDRNHRIVDMEGLGKLP